MKKNMTQKVVQSGALWDGCVQSFANAGFHNAVVFKALNSTDDYLRIQDESLSGELVNLDMASKENLDNLVKVGEQLFSFKGHGVYAPLHNGGTNIEALKKLAKLLSEERKLRLSNAI